MEVIIFEPPHNPFAPSQLSLQYSWNLVNGRSISNSINSSEESHCWGQRRQLQQNWRQNEHVIFFPFLGFCAPFWGIFLVCPFHFWTTLIITGKSFITKAIARSNSPKTTSTRWYSPKTSRTSKWKLLRTTAIYEDDSYQGQTPIYRPILSQSSSPQTRPRQEGPNCSRRRSSISTKHGL